MLQPKLNRAMLLRDKGSAASPAGFRVGSYGEGRVGRIVGNILGGIWVDWERLRAQSGLSPPPPGYPFSLEFTVSPEGVIRSGVVLNWLELSST